MIQMTAEAFRMEIGVPQCWYKTLWKFDSSDEFEIEIEEDYQDLKKLQKHDVFIMEQLVERGYTGKDLTSLNYVKKFLKAITLADIATTNSVYISCGLEHARSKKRNVGMAFVRERRYNI
jgi:hypothetical protein